MKLDISRESGREDKPGLRLDSDEDILNFVRKSLKDSHDWMILKNRDFAERYVKEKMYCAVRVNIQGADGVYDLGAAILERRPTVYKIR